MVLGKLNIHSAKESNTILYHIQKSTQNELKISMKPKSIKFIEKYKGKFYDTGLDDDFLDMTPKIAIKAVKQRESYQIKKFATQTF